MGEFRYVRIEIVSVQVFERFAHGTVDAESLRTGEILVEDVAYEDVREAQALVHARHSPDQPGGRRLVDRAQEVVLAEAPGPSDRCDVELAPQHSGNGQQLAAC